MRAHARYFLDIPDPSWDYRIQYAASGSLACNVARGHEEECMEPEDAAPLTGATTRRDLLRKAGVVGATLAGGSLLAACGGGSGGGGTDAAGKVTIDFWDEPWGGEDYVPTVKKMIAAYERANPGVKIKYRAVPWANFYEVYNTAIASGSAPDVAIAPTFPWRGSLASLDGVTDDWRAKGTLADYIPAAIENQRD